jgi:hypothetical protein
MITYAFDLRIGSQQLGPITNGYKTQISRCPHLFGDKCEACWEKRRQYLERCLVGMGEAWCWENRLRAAKYYEEHDD